MAEKQKDRIIDKVMFYEIPVFKTKLRIVELLFILAIVILGAVLRMVFIDYETHDWKYYIYNWMYEIKSNGGFRALGEPIGDYTAPYMYILTILTYTKFTMLHAVKYVSIVFDYVAAVLLFLIVHEVTGSKHRAMFGFAALVLLPSVIVNGAMWAQCDIIYTTFLLLSVYFMLKENSFFSVLSFAIAFSFKLQAVFLLPFLMILWLKQRVCFRHFALVPLVYVMVSIPEVLLGRSFTELMTVYIRQTGAYSKELSLQYPNIYQLIGNVDTEHMAVAGVVFTIALLGGLAYWLYTKKFTMTKEIIITLALFTVMLTVFFLPKMHERYGFMVDLLAAAYAVCDLRKIYVAILVNLCSVLTYFMEIAALTTVPIVVLAVVMGVLLCVVGYDLYQKVQQEELCPLE